MLHRLGTAYLIRSQYLLSLLTSWGAEVGSGARGSSQAQGQGEAEVAMPGGHMTWCAGHVFPSLPPCFWISGRKFGAKERLAPSLSPRAYFCRAVCLCSSFFDIQHFQTQISHRSSVSHRAGWPHGEFWSADSRVFLQTGEHRPFYGGQGQESVV